MPSLQFFFHRYYSELNYTRYCTRLCIVGMVSGTAAVCTLLLGSYVFVAIFEDAFYHLCNAMLCQW